MEYFHLLHIITFLSLALVGSHAALTTQVYWKTTLPNSPMPKAIRDLLLSGKQPGSTKLNVGGQMAEVHVHNYVTVRNDQLHGYRNTAVTMLAKDMRKGTKLNLEFIKSTSASTFLPRQVADSIPFSSAQLPEILNRVSVKPDSLEAEKIKLTVSQCDQAAIGEEKICATSLESLIDYSTSKLGKKVEAISTEVEKETIKSQGYSITGVKKMGVNDETVVCHRLSYPYPVFYCHYTQKVEAYTVSMVGDDGTNVKAVTVCHIDASTLKAKPESVPVCHLLPEDNLVWVPY
ncbi:hypothetical protein LguiA_036392 [Lonicera macranthoides]